MRKKLILASVLSTALFTFYSSYVHSSYYGAPSGRTGAPGDQTCATTECHSGSIISNSSNVQIALFDNGNPVGAYSPGKKYDVKISVSTSGGEAYGFEATVKDANRAHQGTLGLSTDASVQFTFGTKSYVTHVDPTPVSTGTDEWNFVWTAPSTDKGPVTFYAAVNAASNDGTRFDDQIHTKSLQIASVSSSISPYELFVQNISLYPNPVGNTLHANLVLPDAKPVTMQLYNVQGKVVKTEIFNQTTTGLNNLYLDMLDLSRGFYLLKISSGQYHAVNKIYKN